MLFESPSQVAMEMGLLKPLRTMTEYTRVMELSCQHVSIFSRENAV
jgi:hypothetical protein